MDKKEMVTHKSTPGANIKVKSFILFCTLPRSMIILQVNIFSPSMCFIMFLPVTHLATQREIVMEILEEYVDVGL
jgi:hypothetical protein